jgi:large subunit ribosomal protein L10
MPGKEELFAKLLFLINFPAQRLATVINATGRDLAVVINQAVEQNKFEGEQPPAAPTQVVEQPPVVEAAAAVELAPVADAAAAVEPAPPADAAPVVEEPAAPEVSGGEAAASE